jgi:hypothetical protein
MKKVQENSTTQSISFTITHQVTKQMDRDKYTNRITITISILFDIKILVLNLNITIPLASLYRPLNNLMSLTLNRIFMFSVLKSRI